MPGNSHGVGPRCFVFFFTPSLLQTTPLKHDPVISGRPQELRHADAPHRTAPPHRTAADVAQIRRHPRAGLRGRGGVRPGLASRNGPVGPERGGPDESRAAGPVAARTRPVDRRRAAGGAARGRAVVQVRQESQRRVRVGRYGEVCAHLET